MEANLGTIDRAARIVIGLALIAGALSRSSARGGGSASFPLRPAHFVSAPPIACSASTPVLRRAAKFSGALRLSVLPPRDTAS